MTKNISILFRSVRTSVLLTMAVEAGVLLIRCLAVSKSLQCLDEFLKKELSLLRLPPVAVWVTCHPDDISVAWRGGQDVEKYQKCPV